MDGNTATGASAKTYVDVVLVGRGFKGSALFGALKELCAAYTMRRVAGTSAGAIVAALLAAGYIVVELEQELRSLGFASFQDGSARHFSTVGAALAVLTPDGAFKALPCMPGSKSDWRT
ncbi:patatin-like phospholipase family protein [Streptomyces sp. NPDC047525]|uniref:patatin-like phospholipase family protein n=1 Tax=Streptomyces sp. NPDC047525 TaxID=3155264 RepID=UPI0033EAB005